MRPRSRTTPRFLGTLLFLVFPLSFLPTTASALEFFVDGDTGDDLRSTVAAQSSATPWKTIDHALRMVLPGNTITVLPAAVPYAESAESHFPNVTLRAGGTPTRS